MGLPYLADWRTVTLAASSFPVNLSGLKANTANRLERTEWDLWLALKKRTTPLLRMPTFGDYAIAHPDQAEDIDPRIMKMSAQLRYTIDRQWLILKGKNVQDHGFDQFNRLCGWLVKQTDFSGRGYNWGDTYIDDCANNSDGPGNATTWRRVGTTHHLTFVTQQISSLP